MIHSHRQRGNSRLASKALRAPVPLLFSAITSNLNSNCLCRKILPWLETINFKRSPKLNAILTNTKTSNYIDELVVKSEQELDERSSFTIIVITLKKKPKKNKSFIEI